MATGAQASEGAGDRAGDTAAEWPLTAAAVAAAVSATRAALAAEAGTAPQPVPDWSAVDSDDFARAVRVHRIAPLLAAQAVAIDAPKDVRLLVRTIAKHDAVKSLELAREAERAVSAVQAAGVRVAVMKGVALSVLTTGVVTARTGGDIDLLVGPDDLRTVHAVLVAAGWAGDEPGEPGRAWSWYLRMRRERTYASNESVIDLHWRVGWHDRPMPTTADLLMRAEPVALLGATVPTLSPSDSLAAACYHAAVDRYARLRGLVDVVRLVRRTDVGPVPGADWRVRRLVGETVGFCDVLLGGMPAERVARFVPADGVQSGRARDEWAHSSLRQIWSEHDVPLPELIGIYRDSARYAGARAALVMAVTDALLPPERMAPDDGPADLVRTVGAEVADLVRRRIHPQPTA
jgi:hypothetical protein